MSTGKTGPKTYILEVMPLTRGRAASLSYFSTEKPAPGTLVKIRVRNTLARGIVMNVRSALSARADIRQAGFQLKKISARDIFAAGLSPELLSAVKRAAIFYGTNDGALLSSLLPKMLLEEPEKFFRSGNKKKNEIEKRETLVMQMESEERYGQYRGLVRQCFARKKSLMLIVPTIHDAERARLALSQGIEPFVYNFFLGKKPAEAKLAWHKALEDRHPVLFITTPAGICFDRPDIDMIIIERENSRAYRTLSRPYIHFKTVAEILAKASGRQLVLGDSVLSLETLWREKRGDFGEMSLVRWRLPAAPTTLVDVKARADADGKFTIISKELKGLIEKALEEKEEVLLFGARKGLSPTTVCGDCGFVLPCLNCGAPAVLHRDRNGGNIYICHACGEKRDSSTVCGYCGSWKLVPLGIGIEKIGRELRELFPEARIDILDKDYAPTDASARRIAQNFKENGGILVGTELAFFHLDKVGYSGVVSADSLFSIPDFGINERIFYLISRLREMTSRESVVQTRNIGKQILAWASLGNIIDFYQNEINERKSLLYPPFSIFAKITPLSPRAKTEVPELRNKLLAWHPDIYQGSIILRVPKEEWPDEKLSRELALLGPEFSIKVDAESIL